MVMYATYNGHTQGVSDGYIPGGAMEVLAFKEAPTMSNLLANGWPAKQIWNSFGHFFMAPANTDQMVLVDDELFFVENRTVSTTVTPVGKWNPTEVYPKKGGN